MGKNIKSKGIEKEMVKAATLVRDAVCEFRAKLNDMDQKLDHLIRRQNNGQNHY